MLKILFTTLFIFTSSLAYAKGIDNHTLSLPLAAPDSEFYDSEGLQHKLNDFKGKVILLNFWATWCKPCVEEMPSISRLQDAIKDKDIVIVPVSLDAKGETKVPAFYKKHGITNLPAYFDAKFKAYSDFSVQALPMTFIIDKKGMIVASIPGSLEWDSDEVKEYVLGVAQ